jgi:hypothetical protein
MDLVEHQVVVEGMEIYITPSRLMNYY